MSVYENEFINLTFFDVLCKLKFSCSSRFAFSFTILVCIYIYGKTSTFTVSTSLLQPYMKCSVTNMLLQLGLPSFDTVLHNARIRFANNLHFLDNSVVSVSCML